MDVAAMQPTIRRAALAALFPLRYYAYITSSPGERERDVRPVSATRDSV